MVIEFQLIGVLVIEIKIREYGPLTCYNMKQ